MTSAVYYPEPRHALAYTTIQRERVMPEDALGDLRVNLGERVEMQDIIAQGVVPSRFVIVEAAALLRLRKPDDLLDKVAVEVSDFVEAGQQLVEGRRRLAAPVTGVVSYIGEGRIILQETPAPIELKAGLSGQVVSLIEPRGAVIETSGAVLQGVWGNNRSTISVLRTEPEDGLESVLSDAFDIEFRGAVIVTRRPLKPITMQVIADQEFTGVIAPSMDASLIDMALESPAAIMLTEGFGNIRMGQFSYSFLESLNNKQVTLDAILPDRFDSRRPEAIVHLPPRPGYQPEPPNPDITLRTGMKARLTRGDHAGLVGDVVHLPRSPILLDNGLRTMCAQVQLATGETVLVPLANLETLGA